MNIIERNIFLSKIQPLAIYEDFKYPSIEPEIQGWCSHQHILEKYIELAKPNLVIEVGTWKGLSAITMAKQIKTLNLDSKVLCVDTWLGGSEHWDDMFNNLVQFMEHGSPIGLYRQFLSNVIKSECENIIVPLPSTSRSAAELLLDNKINADIIYIDGSHIYDEVLSDCICYSQLLTEDGYLIFDDYASTWLGVYDAVNDFLKSSRDFKTIEQYGPCLVVQKASK